MRRGGAATVAMRASLLPLVLVMGAGGFGRPSSHPQPPEPPPPPCRAHTKPTPGSVSACTSSTSNWTDCRCPSADPLSWPPTWASMQNSPMDKTKLDPRCCLLEWLRDTCDAEANAVAKSRIDFTMVSRKATDLWAALSTNERQSGEWNFVNGPSCLVQANATQGKTVSMRFPPGWSGNTFATRAGWVSSQAGQQVKWGGAAHSILLEYTFGCTSCADQSTDAQFWWDLSAIPNSEPGQCVVPALTHHSCKQVPTQCDPALKESMVVYGNNDVKECRGEGSKASDPGGWFKWQNDKVINGNWSLVPPWGADSRAPAKGHGYRYSWFGTPACYNYDDCKAKAMNGGVDAFLCGRGFSATVPLLNSRNASIPEHTSQCAFDGWKGYWRDNNHIQSHPGGVSTVSCTFGSMHSEIGGTFQDCMTSPHEDWKSLACTLNLSLAQAEAASSGRALRHGDNSSLLLQVSVCQWGDQTCSGGQVYPDPPPVPNVYACDSKAGPPRQKCCRGSYNCPESDICRCSNGTHPPSPPGSDKYTCTGTPYMQCVRDANGKFGSMGACNASCVTHFTCTGSPDRFCVQAANGKFASEKACNASCLGPSPPSPSPSKGKYTCTGTPLKKCIPDANGKFASEAACHTGCVNRFTCTGSPATQCVQAADGQFTSEAACHVKCQSKPPSKVQCNPHAHPKQNCEHLNCVLCIGFLMFICVMMGYSGW
jgi:hypothetical protein